MAFEADRIDAPAGLLQGIDQLEISRPHRRAETIVLAIGFVDEQRALAASVALAQCESRVDVARHTIGFDAEGVEPCAGAPGWIAAVHHPWIERLVDHAAPAQRIGVHLPKMREHSVEMRFERALHLGLPAARLP